MASLSEIKQARLEKLNKLKARGDDPYPVSTKRDMELAEVVENFSKLSKSKKSLTLVGRIIARRGQGGLLFFDFSDGSAVFQGIIKKDEVGEDVFMSFADLVDIGDFVEVSGSLIETKRKEKSILLKGWKMLSKSLRPLPEKWHGLQDVEERFRRRYLDLLANPDVKERFLKRSKIISELRSILDEENFVEVETPSLQPLSGGASAEPFVTHHNALDIDLFLRVAPELYLKRLLVGGLSKVYEIGRNFRNEGIDVTHNPEFTMLEYYESYSDAEKQMKFIEVMFKRLVKEIEGSSSLTFDGEKISFSKSFTRVSYFDLLTRHALIENPGEASLSELLNKAAQLGLRVPEGSSREKVLDSIYKHSCRPKLIQPTFVTGYPKHYLPLAKEKPDEEGIVDAFQLVVGGLEVVKAFSELNDPVEQRERFEEQEKMRSEGDAEAQRIDQDFLEALEHGMPPAGGVGIGVDRLVMLLTDTKNIREVVLFPTLRPKQG